MKKMIIGVTFALIGSTGLMAATVDLDKNTYDCVEKADMIYWDTQKAIQSCKKAAQSGNPIAEFYYGRVLSWSGGSDSAKEESKRMLQKAFPKIKDMAEKNNRYAAKILFDYYASKYSPIDHKSNDDIEKWRETALNLFNPHLNQNDTYAQYVYFKLSQNQSDKEYYSEKLALEKNILLYQNWLARDYQISNGKELTDRQKKILQLSAKSGYLNAQHYLGWCYSEGKCGFEQNNKLAFEWVYKASQQEYINSDVHLLLGWMYGNGAGIKKDYTKAIKHTKLALVNAYSNKEQAQKNLEYYERESKRNPAEEAKQAEYDRKHQCDGFYPGKNFKVHTTGLFGGDEKARITGVDKDGGQVSFEWYDGAIREWRQEETTCTYLKTQMR